MEKLTIKCNIFYPTILKKNKILCFKILSNFEIYYYFPQSLKLHSIIMDKKMKNDSKDRKSINLIWNDPIDLKSDDRLHLKARADNIKNFLTEQTNNADRSTIIALFGEWGSGKTTILNYIEKKIKKEEEYVVLKFNAWEYEKDGNLILSIIDALKDINKSKLKEIKNLLKSSVNFLYTFSSCVSLNFGPMNFDFDKIDKKFNKQGKLSNYEEIEKFKETYEKLEDIILDNKNKIIVLIDEIDRCDPENVINMINFIKLFFTYGKRSIFLIALDENALIQAIDFRYHSKIKANEYIEKIFDFSFRMPGFNPIQELVYYYFNKDNFSEIEGNFNVSINRFLYAIKFTNPRRVKKVFSKFIYLKIISEKEENKELFAAKDIFLLKNEKVLYIIIQLFLIILFEFYNEKFFEIDNYNLKIKEILTSINNARVIQNPTSIIKDYNNNLMRNINVDRQYYHINQLKNEIDKGKTDKNLLSTKQYFMKILSLFLPIPPMKIEFDGNLDVFTIISQFENKDNIIIIDFCRFLVNNENLIKNNECAIPIKQCFDIAKNYL